jgi:hypothetical protein
LLDVAVITFRGTAKSEISLQAFLRKSPAYLCDDLERSVELGAGLELAGLGEEVVDELLADVVAAG